MMLLKLNFRHFLISFSLVALSGFVNAQDVFYKFLGEHEDDVEAVAVSGDGRFIATGSWDNTITVFNNDSSFSWLATLRGHQSTVSSLSFSRNGEYLLSGSKDYKTILWKLGESGTYFMQDTVYQFSMGSPVTDVLLGPAMRMVFSASADGKISMFDRSKRKLRVIENKSPVSSIALSTNRRFVYVADETTIVKQYDVFGKVIRTFEGHSDQVNAVGYSLNNKYVVTASSDKKAIVWNALTGKQVHVLEGHDWKVNCLDISVDSKYLLTGSSDGFTILWNLETGEQIKKFEGMGAYVRRVAFSRDSKHVFIALHREGENIEYGVVVWGTGIKKPVAAAKPKPKELPKHLQKYAPKPTTPARTTTERPKPTPEKAPAGKKIIKKTDEVEISIDE